MKMQINLSVLTLVAIGACLLLPAYAADKLVDRKIYVVRRVKTATETDLLIGISIARDEKGEEVSTGVFGILPPMWEPLFKRQIPAHVSVEEVALEDLPVSGLRELFKHRPELYSKVLPSLLAKFSPHIVADSFPGELLDTLTPEDKAKIAPEVLEELEKLYDY